MTPDPSIPAAIASTYDGSDLRIRRDLGGTADYTRHAISYESDGLTITGIMNRPRGKGPFPVVVLAHGYIEPSSYWSGQGFRREQDWLARSGYVALHVDFRNHAGSDDDPANDLVLRLGYAADVINAGLAVRSSNLPFIDSDRVALLGRSMGGGVAFQALVIRPVLMIHGTEDESCDIAWARATERALTLAGKDVTLVEYRGAGHYLYGPWADSIRRVTSFLSEHLPA